MTTLNLHIEIDLDDEDNLTTQDLIEVLGAIQDAISDGSIAITEPARSLFSQTSLMVVRGLQRGDTAVRPDAIGQIHQIERIAQKPEVWGGSQLSNMKPGNPEWRRLINCGDEPVD